MQSQLLPCIWSAHAYTTLSVVLISNCWPGALVQLMPSGRPCCRYWPGLHSLHLTHAVAARCRSCRRKTFEAQGLPAVSRLALANCRDLLPLIQWNRGKGIHFFRIPSALFPWSHEYELEQLPGERGSQMGSGKGGAGPATTTPANGGS